MYKYYSVICVLKTENCRGQNCTNWTYIFIRISGNVRRATKRIIRFSFPFIETNLSQCRFLDFYCVNSVFSFFAIMMNHIKLLLKIRWYSCSLCLWVFPTTSQTLLKFPINFCWTVLRANNKIKDELHENVSKQRCSNSNKEMLYWRVPYPQKASQ